MKEKDFLLNVLSNYEKFDKKVIMRIIFALLGLDSKHRAPLVSTIKQLLLRAVGDRADGDEVSSSIIHILMYFVPL